jgi:hypothetical protein
VGSRKMSTSSENRSMSPQPLDRLVPPLKMINPPAITVNFLPRDSTFQLPIPSRLTRYSRRGLALAESGPPSIRTCKYSLQVPYGVDLRDRNPGLLLFWFPIVFTSGFPVVFPSVLTYLPDVSLVTGCFYARVSIGRGQDLMNSKAHREKVQLVSYHPDFGSVIRAELELPSRSRE